MKNYFAQVLLGFLLSLTIGCAVDPIDDLPAISLDSTHGVENPEAIKAWVWAMDSLSDSVRLVHTLDKKVWETHALPYSSSRLFQEAEKIGGYIYPTWWTHTETAVYAFTNGILDHGDHGHIVRALHHVSIAFPNDTVYELQATPDGQYTYAVLNQSLMRIGYNKGDTLRIFLSIKPRKIALLSEIAIIIDHENRSYIYSLKENSLSEAVELPEKCFDAWADTSSARFWMACANHVMVYDPKSMQIQGQKLQSNSIESWTSSYFRRSAIGWTNNGSCTQGPVIVFKDNQEAKSLVIPGACFPGVDDLRKTDISEDGMVALMADTHSKKIYQVDLKTGTYQSLSIPYSVKSVALNYDGSRSWFLTTGMVYQVSFKSLTVVDSIAVHQGTESISVSSYLNNGALFDAEDHIF